MKGVGGVGRGGSDRVSGDIRATSWRLLTLRRRRQIISLSRRECAKAPTELLGRHDSTRCDGSSLRVCPRMSELI